MLMPPAACFSPAVGPPSCPLPSVPRPASLGLPPLEMAEVGKQTSWKMVASQLEGGCFPILQ